MFKRAITTLICLFVFIVAFPSNQLNADTFTTTFFADGGTYPEGETVEVLVDGDTKVIDENGWPIEPTKLGYNFDGYAVNDERIEKDHEFSENTTVKALWSPKHTNITLNMIDGEGGDQSVEAIYDAQLPDITVPSKEGFAFVGYFDEVSNQYYDADGKSLRTWDKDATDYELFASYEEAVLLEEPLLGEPLEKCVVTADLDGGTFEGDAPEGWTLSDEKYTKQYDKGTTFETIIGEWNNIAIDKEGYIKYGWGFEPIGDGATLNEDTVIKFYYYEASNISSSIDGHGTIETKTNKIIKNSWIYFEENRIVDYNDRTKVLVEVTPEEGYDVDYWIINGEQHTGNDYFVNSDISVKPHLVQSYGLKIFGKLVTVDNYDDILEDGSCSYDPDTKTLTLLNPNDDTGEERISFYQGIVTPYDLTINSSTNTQITSAHVENYNGISGDISIVCGGTLTLNFDKKLDIKTLESNGISAAIYTNNLVINKGTYDLIGNTYGIYATGTITVNSANSPYISSYTSNTTAIMSSGMNLNGAYVYGSTEEYVEGTTTNLLQKGQSPVIISFASLSKQYDLWVSGVRITDDNKNNGTNYKYDSDTNTLTLTGYIPGVDGYGIYCLGDLNIKVGSEENKDISIYNFTSSVMGESYGIYCDGDLLISSDYDDSTLHVTSCDASLRSIGIYCDGILTITSKVEAKSNKTYNTGNEFSISAGTWARGGIGVAGQDPSVIYLSSKGGTVKSSSNANYGILCGDGNPGMDEGVSIGVYNGKILAEAESTSSSSYGVYSFGEINLLVGEIAAKINENATDDSSIIYCAEDMFVRDSSILCDDIAFYNENIVVRGLEVGGTLTIDNSDVRVTKTTNEYKKQSIKLKKYQGIYATNLNVKGEYSHVESFALNTVSGDSSAIYIKEKMTVEGGYIKAYGDSAGGNSYGIFAGNNSFDGYHTITGTAAIIVGADEAGDGESVGLRTKKGELRITGGVVTANGKDYGISASGVIYVNPDQGNMISLGAESANDGEGGNVAIKSKEVLQLNNAVIENARNEYDPTSTCELIQDGAEFVYIYFRIPVIIEGISLNYPYDDNHYVYGDEINYSGTPVAYELWGGEIVDEIETSSYTYTYQKQVGEDEWVDLEAAPIDVGEYRLFVDLLTSTYEGHSDLRFSINKKEITYFFDPLYYDYDGEPYSPAIYYDGFEYGDDIYFTDVPIFNVYNSGNQTIYTPSECGVYDLEVGITDDMFDIYDINERDVSDNYDLSNLIGGIRVSFCISDSKVKNGNIITTSVNSNSNILDTYLRGLSVDDVKDIFKNSEDPVCQSFLKAIENDEKIMFIAQTDEITNQNDFASKDRNNSNAILLDIKLYAQCGNKGKVLITDTGNALAKLSITVSNEVANKIIGSNKNYFVYRLHNGEINKIDCDMRKSINNYVFDFYTNKFSSYAIISENKPEIKYPDNYTYHKVPNTLIIH